MPTVGKFLKFDLLLPYFGRVSRGLERASSTLPQSVPTGRAFVIPPRAIEKRVRVKTREDHPEEPEAIEVKYAITASVLPSAILVDSAAEREREEFTHCGYGVIEGTRTLDANQDNVAVHQQRSRR
jgi:hypothetical protein